MLSHDPGEAKTDKKVYPLGDVHYTVWTNEKYLPKLKHYPRRQPQHKATHCIIKKPRH